MYLKRNIIITGKIIICLKDDNYHKFTTIVFHSVYSG